MKGARGVLINITGGLDMTLFEVDEAANRIREEVDPDANIIFGSTFDEKLDGRMRISVVATGIEAEAAAAAPGHQPGQQPAGSGRVKLAAATTGGYTQPVLTQNAAAPKTEPSRSEPRPESAPEPCRPPPRQRKARPCATARFIAPQPVDAGPARPVPLTQPAVPRGLRCRPPRAKGRVPSLIERVTGVGRARVAAAARRAGKASRSRRPRGSPPRGPATVDAARAGRAAEREQGRRSARHPSLPAPPSQLNRRRPAHRLKEHRGDAAVLFLCAVRLSEISSPTLRRTCNNP